MARTALRTFITLLVSLVAVFALPTTVQAKSTYYFQFMDRNTGQIIPDNGQWLFNGNVEIILASDNADVRQLLPITFKAILNGQGGNQTVFSGTATSASQDCRGTTGCSVHGLQGPTPPAGSTLALTATDAQGNVITLYTWQSNQQTQTQPTATPQTAHSPPPTTTTTTPPTTTTQQTVTENVCWWCVGLKLFFVLTLICVLITYIITSDWWSWWMLWYVLIFAWIPMWLGWFWFFNPKWWWIAQLGWLPLLGGFAWWGMRRSWWAPWMRIGFLGWGLSTVFGIFLWSAWHWSIGPLFIWLPWFYVWYHPLIRPGWWRPWMWGGVGLFGLWFLGWLTWLGPWWAWFIPVLVGGAFLWWWFWQDTWSWWWPGWAFFVPWILWPWFAYMNSEWDIWWCAVIFVWFFAYLVWEWWTWIWNSAWWNWWGWWWIGIFVWLPLFNAWNWFAWPWWWWIPHLLWFPLIGGVGYYWARHQPWWKPWYWYGVGGWAAVLALGFLSTTTNYGYGITSSIPIATRWWFQLPFLYLPWAGFFMYAYFMRQSWWRPRFWWLFGAYATWLFIWLIWLNPFWWWVIGLWAFPFFGWWLWWTNNTWWRQKLCWGIPWIGLPLLGYATWICAEYGSSLSNY